jgi:ribosomal protein S18 acetylase RimI-like enzyme
MEVRPVREDELPTLVDERWTPFARKMTEDDPYYALVDEFREDVVAYRRELFADDDTSTRVAVDDGALLGSVAAEYREAPPVHQHGDTLHITQVYVRPAHRPGESAPPLLDEAEDWGSTRGCAHVTLTVDRVIESAQALYEDLRFAVTRCTMRTPTSDCGRRQARVSWSGPGYSPPTISG